MIGGGIVGLPYAFLELGVLITIALLAVVTLQTQNSSWLYLKAKDLIPGKPESLYEIGYMLMGRKSIFILSIILALNSFGMVMVYFIVYGNTIQSVIIDLTTLTEDDIIGGKQFWIIILSVFLLPVCMKKEL